MIGEVGTAETAVDPDGVVLVRDAPWRARTNRATPIKAGEPVRVADIDGLVLEVEPLEGAARDYRERGEGGTAAAVVHRADLGDPQPRSRKFALVPELDELYGRPG